MLWSISWRNVWRNKKRSAIIVSAIGFGLWAGLLFMALSIGWGEQMLQSAFDTRISHVHIFEKGFYESKEIGKSIPSGLEILREVRQRPEVEAAVGRVRVTAMVTSPVTGAGVMVQGVVPEDERLITKIYDMLTEGTYFETNKRNPVILGEKLVEKLEVKMGSKVVLTAQRLDGDITAGAFRVVGIYKTVSSSFDAMTVFVNRGDIDRILGLDGRIHEIAVVARDYETISDLTESISNEHPELNVVMWSDLAPDLGYLEGAMAQLLYIFVVVILLALVFGIVNTMLMSVLERIRELGVLMAVGMKHGRIFLMVVLESIMLAILGGAVGLVVGVASVAFLGRVGIDLSYASETLATWGSSAIIYPHLPLAEYPKLLLLVIVVAVLSAIYPAIKAVKINPVKAIRTY